MNVSVKNIKNKVLFGVGRIKDAVASAKISRDLNNILIVNKVPFESYFGEKKAEEIKNSLINIFNLVNETFSNFSIEISVSGGGIIGQSNAVKFAIVEALKTYLLGILPEENFKVQKSVLRKAGFIKRDLRQKEKKKAGKLKARKSQPFVKR